MMAGIPSCADRMWQRYASTRRIFLLFAWACLIAAVACKTTPGGGALSSNKMTDSGPARADFIFYVSPGGADSNSGRTKEEPLQTLGAAQQAIRALGQPGLSKSVYLLSGTYPMSAALRLSAEDQNISWLAAPGEKPILDGGGRTELAFELKNAANTTIKWLTIQNFALFGINAVSSQNLKIESNTFKEIKATGWEQAVIQVKGSAKNGRIANNLIVGSDYIGIAAAFADNFTFDGFAIEYNIVLDTLRVIKDGGGIYFRDRGHSNTPVRIAHNIVGNHGPMNDESQTKGIYLDDKGSHVTVENNIIFGTGTYALQIHGGNDNLVKNNIIDISNSQRRLGLYQDMKQGQNFGMNNNVFECNIVYSDRIYEPWEKLWLFYNDQGGASPLTIRRNIYWNDSIRPENGELADVEPIKKDPQFENLKKGSFRSAPPDTCFRAFDTGLAGPRPNVDPARPEQQSDDPLTSDPLGSSNQSAVLDCRTVNWDGTTCADVNFSEGQEGKPWGEAAGIFKCENGCIRWLRN